MKLLLSGALWSRVGAVLIAATLLGSAPSSAAVYLSVSIAPPLLPVYEQPLIPGPGYIWTPGYWAWGPNGYYWVPGTWVLAPFIGALWTPGYWGWRNDFYWWQPGYWGPHVGYYGGINYGFGYTGIGYQGGYWDRGVFTYNRTVNNVNVTNIRNVYNTTVVNNTSVTRVSYNGGPSGVVAQPTAPDRIAAREVHTPLLPVQARHELAASSNHALLASVNNGHPALAATPRPQPLSAVGSAPGRSFSQQAAAHSSTAPLHNDVIGPNQRLSNEPRFEHRTVPVNRSVAQFQTAPRPQAAINQQGPMHPQAQMRPQPEMPPMGAPHREGRPQQAHGGGGERPDERQHP